MKTMEISLGRNGWECAHYIDGVPEGAVVALFGTHVLPSAYTVHTPAAEVIAALERLNPEHSVTVKGA